MSDAEKIINEINIFLEKSMLKTSQITKEEIIDFIEKKWAEADEEKYENYSAYIISSRMIHEYMWKKDFGNMMRWMEILNLHNASKNNPSYFRHYYAGKCCLECGNEEKALEYFNLCYTENADYIFSQDSFCYEFFNRHIEHPRDLSHKEIKEYESADYTPLKLEYWQSFFNEDDDEFDYEIWDENDEYTDEPTQEQHNGFDYLQINQKMILENILSELLKKYTELQKIYNYPEEDKVDFMPDLNNIQGFANLLSPNGFYITSVIKNNHPYIGISFSCSWDGEHGLGIMTHKNKVIEIGEADVAFSSWAAEDDL
ncbi:hypothetical protein BBI01_12710 [Chryseobacterium artocarpi]|uniref:DUF6985 domain-containing protein n=1 Tax=Chryseobacterium artocarpi TaxID=1414727 RepID=A0A1B8ZGZ3_9FLAO|nr:hypothetical protein [Chryseobacterium artocarpi]OCA70796.1 hypothetical protein BBI01_12710 [Chryseobacterium artocarpi]